MEKSRQTRMKLGSVKCDQCSVEYSMEFGEEIGLEVIYIEKIKCFGRKGTILENVHGVNVKNKEVVKRWNGYFQELLNRNANQKAETARLSGKNGSQR